MDESKGQRIAKAPSLHLFTLQLDSILRAAARSSPIPACSYECYANVFEFYTLTTMTSLQFTQACGLGTRGIYRVPLSIQTYDSGVIKVHSMVLASSPGHFPPPTWPRNV